MTDQTPVESLEENAAAAELERIALEMAEHDRRYYQDDAPIFLCRHTDTSC